MKISLDFDDFSPRNSNFHLLEKLREHYPKFRVTMFTVPWEIRFHDQSPITQDIFRPWVNAIRKNQDWIDIAYHGMTHFPMEFAEVSYEEALKRIQVAKRMFKNTGIKTVKLFKAPFWALSKGGEKAVKKEGLRVVKDGYYNWNLADERPKRKKVLIGHGHVQNTMGNGLEECFHKLLKLPVKAEWVRLKDVI